MDSTYIDLLYFLRFDCEALKVSVAGYRSTGPVGQSQKHVLSEPEA